VNTDVQTQDFVSLVSRKSQKSAELETKEFSALLSIKSIDEKSRRITALASTGDIDRHDEVILPEAFRESLPIFMKNPVVLAAHQNRLSDGTSPVVANIVAASITPVGLEVIIEFHTFTRIAEEYWQLYSQKKQRALSVGFKPLEGGYENINGKSVYIHRKVELFEVSCVPIGANPNALSKSKQRKADFIAEKIAQRKDEKRSDEFAEILLDGDFKALGIPECEEDEFELSGETDLDFEPDYVKTVNANRSLQTDIYKDMSLEIKTILNDQRDLSRCIC